LFEIDDQPSRAPAASLAVEMNSEASTFLPPSGCRRVILKRPSAQTTVKLSASTATISPSLPAIPLGSLAGSGLASKIFSVLPSSVVQAPGAGLQPRIRRSICSHGLPQSILALPGPQRPSYVAFDSSCLMRGALPAFTRSTDSIMASTPIGNRRSKYTVPSVSVPEIGVFFCSRTSPVSSPLSGQKIDRPVSFSPRMIGQLIALAPR